MIGGVVAAFALSGGKKHHKAATTARTVVITRSVVQTTTAPPTTVSVPKAVGLTVADASTLLQNSGLKTQTRQVSSSQPAGVVVSQAPSAGSMVKPGTTVTLNVSQGAPKVTMPLVLGLTEQEATAKLRALGLVVSLAHYASQKPAGTVTGQRPPAGDVVAKGAHAQINASSGPPSTTTTTTPATTTASTAPTTTQSQPPPAPATTTVPNVVGMQLADARKAMRTAHLVTEVHYVPSQQPLYTVVAEQPAAGRTVKTGSHVLVNASLGPTKQTLKAVPNVVGLNEATATSKLQNAGFAVDSVDQPTSDPNQDGTVVDEQPASGQQAPPGSNVTIYVARYSSGG